jgi:hypothetical protein
MWTIVKAILFRLPFIAVLAIGGLTIGMVVAAIKLGIIILKLLVFVVLIWLVWKVAKWAQRSRDDGDHRAPETPTSAEGSA